MVVFLPPLTSLIQESLESSAPLPPKKKTIKKGRKEAACAEFSAWAWLTQLNYIITSLQQLSLLLWKSYCRI